MRTTPAWQVGRGSLHAPVATRRRLASKVDRAGRAGPAVEPPNWSNGQPDPVKTLTGPATAAQAYARGRGRHRRPLPASGVAHAARVTRIRNRGKDAPQPAAFTIGDRHGWGDRDGAVTASAGMREDAIRGRGLPRSREASQTPWSPLWPHPLLAPPQRPITPQTPCSVARSPTINGPGQTPACPTSSPRSVSIRRCTDGIAAAT